MKNKGLIQRFTRNRHSKSVNVQKLLQQTGGQMPTGSMGIAAMMINE